MDQFMEERARGRFQSVRASAASSGEKYNLWVEAVDLARFHVHRHLYILAGREMVDGKSLHDGSTIYDREILKLESQTRKEFVMQLFVETASALLR